MRGTKVTGEAIRRNRRPAPRRPITRSDWECATPDRGKADASAPAAEDALARRWSLTAADVAEVLRARGTEHRLRCAVQLCTLRATGRFVSDYRRIPPEAVNHLAAQLGLGPLLFLPDPERPATESAHLQRIRQHLGWHEFD